MAGFLWKVQVTTILLEAASHVFTQLTMQKTGEKEKRDEQFFISPLSPKLCSFLFLWSAATSTFGFSLAMVDGESGEWRRVNRYDKS